MLWGAEGGTGARQANRGREAHRCRRQGGEGNLLCTSNEARLFGEQPLPSLFRWVLATLQAGAEWWWPCRALLAVVLRCKWVGRMVHWHWDCPSLSLRRRTDHNGSQSPLSAAPQKNELRARPARKTKEWVEGQATLQSAVVGQAIPTQFRSCTGGADGAGGASGVGL